SRSPRTSSGGPTWPASMRSPATIRILKAGVSRSGVSTKGSRRWATTSSTASSTRTASSSCPTDRPTVGSAPFHLGWFGSGQKPPSWNTTWSGSSDYDWVNAEFLIDLARACERAKFDLVLHADTSWISYDHGGTAEIDLKYCITGPRNDLAAL